MTFSFFHGFIVGMNAPPDALAARRLEAKYSSQGPSGVKAAVPAAAAPPTWAPVSSSSVTVLQP
jgi:hypothetical protein